MDAAHQINLVPKDPPFTLQIKRILVDNYSPDFPSIQFVANQLFTTPRTIQRKLKKEHTSFSELILKIKMAMAKFYLKDSKFAISEIAFLIGYSEASAFIRAFKKNCAITPAQFRQLDSSSV